MDKNQRFGGQFCSTNLCKFSEFWSRDLLNFVGILISIWLYNIHLLSVYVQIFKKCGFMCLLCERSKEIACAPIFCHLCPKMMSKNGQNLAAWQKNGCNSVIFCPISMNLVCKVIYSSRPIDWRNENDCISFRLDFRIFRSKKGRSWRKMARKSSFLDEIQFFLHHMYR